MPVVSFTILNHPFLLGLVVTFKVRERDPLYGNFFFETSDNEANLHLFTGLKNILGHAESLEFSHLMGTRGTRKTELRYNMPLVHYLQVKSSYLILTGILLFCLAQC